MGFLITAIAFAVLRVAMAESLWLDELHTSWTISGSWQEIATRAAAGNQTPLYFWFVGVVTQTVGERPERILRVPSAVAWLLAIGLVAWQIRSKIPSRDPQGWLFALCIVAWIVLDRLQWFYATEARPYAFVQLVSLTGWCCVEAIVQAENRPNRAGTLTGTLIVVWCILSVANIYLHLTAALPVLFQWLVGIVFFWRNQNQHRSEEKNAASPVTTRRPLTFLLAWTLGAVGVGMALLPILQLAFPVWQRRAQWATFASDVSIQKATSMFPFVPVLLCVLVSCVVDRIWPSKLKPVPIAIEVRWLWWTALLGPFLLAWALAATGVAPMFHQRFEFASAMPLFVVGAMELLRCRHWTMRWVTILAVAIVISQGSLPIWRSGYLVGTLRGEDWRAATRWVNERLELGEPLLCYSGLIEANSNLNKPITLPLDADFAEYLSFPLLGVYRIAGHSGQPIPVTPLLGDHRQWAAQILERLAEAPAGTERIWLVYRGALGKLKTKMVEFQADLRMKDIVLNSSEPKRFGNLYVVELKR